jgi:V-type H+-transporting ATPase subunit G
MAVAESEYLAQLTSAERRSNEIIKTAQDAREKRLKEAKFDAEQELGKTRTGLEAEFVAASSQVTAGTEELAVIRKKTEEDILHSQTKFAANKTAALDFLLERIMQVDLSVPAVVKGKFDLDA